MDNSVIQELCSVKTSEGAYPCVELETISPFVVCVQHCAVPSFLTYFTILPSWFVFIDTFSVCTQRGFKGQMQLMGVFCVCASFLQNKVTYNVTV